MRLDHLKRIHCDGWNWIVDRADTGCQLPVCHTLLQSMLRMMRAISLSIREGAGLLFSGRMLSQHEERREREKKKKLCEWRSQIIVIEKKRSKIWDHGKNNWAGERPELTWSDCSQAIHTLKELQTDSLARGFRQLLCWILVLKFQPWLGKVKLGPTPFMEKSKQKTVLRLSCVKVVIYLALQQLFLNVIGRSPGEDFQASPAPVTLTKGFDKLHFKCIDPTPSNVKTNNIK